MPFPIAERWFERKKIDSDLTLIWETHVHPLLRCNIWHLRGRDRDLMIDTGLGVSSLKEATHDLLDGKSVLAVGTHCHLDHIGDHHEFEHCCVHAAEKAALENLREGGDLGSALAYFGKAGMDYYRAAGLDMPDDASLIDALPHAGYDPAAFTIPPAKVSEVVEEGDVISTGDRAFEVLHLPGHSPGSMGLFEKKTGIFFSGDCIYDGPLLDELDGSNIAHYIATMKRLRDLPVTVVHGGHDDSFGRERLHELIDAYLKKRDR